MISVLTLTYKRHHLLEEAIQSFILQNRPDCEMLVINDNPEVDYILQENPNVRIFNLKTRFDTISDKIKWGYKQSKFEFIYRLDDDDLLAPNGLNLAISDILSNPNFEIYRSKGMYFFNNNNFEGMSSNINNGNIYSKKYLDRIKFPKKSGDEDVEITFGNGANIFEPTQNTPTMIYRWGMNTLHISGLGNVPTDTIFRKADEFLDNTKGLITIIPHFKQDYYSKLVSKPKNVSVKIEQPKNIKPTKINNIFNIDNKKLKKSLQKNNRK